MWLRGYSNRAINGDLSIFDLKLKNHKQQSEQKRQKDKQ